MATLNVKDNWDDSSESEVEVDDEVKVDDEVDSLDMNEYKHEDDEEWDFYEGYTSCINCGKSNEVRIIMIESKRVFCYNVCLDNGNDGYDDDDYDDDYDELDDYDRKLGLSVSCR